MKLSTIKSAKFLLMALVLLNVMSCNTDDDDPKTPVTEYYNMEELLKLHNGNENQALCKSFAGVFEDYKMNEKRLCFRYIYTFKIFAPGEVTQDVVLH